VRPNVLCLALALLLGTAHIFPLSAQTPAGDPARGKIRSKAEQCQECHGEFGISTAEHYPKLAGQNLAYIRKQLRDFQSGARKNEIMTAMAAELSPQDIADIAAWFSSAPRMSAEHSFADRAGQALFEKGDPARALPACASCHGEKGLGGGTDVDPAPVLSGQRELYLTSQLASWRVDGRINSSGGVMNGVAHGLGDSDIFALSRYLAGLRASE